MLMRLLEIHFAKTLREMPRRHRRTSIGVDSKTIEVNIICENCFSNKHGGERAIVERDRESLNYRLRDALLSSDIFTKHAEAQLLCARWRADYKYRRPQHALGKKTPTEYTGKCEVSAERRRVERMKMTGNTRNATSIMIAETS